MYILVKILLNEQLYTYHSGGGEMMIIGVNIFC